MKPAPFDYHRPESLEEALELLVDGDAKVLAGGQSLVPMLSMRLAAPAGLVDINRLPDLDAIEVDPIDVDPGDGDPIDDAPGPVPRGVRIGALTRHAALERDEAAFRANPLLRRAVSSVAHATIRNRGTTVGSLVHADPAAEMPAVLRLLGGEVEVASRDRGTRTIHADALFVGPLESALAPDEVALSAFFPHPPPGSGSAWVELARRHGDYAMVGVGAVVTPDESGAIARAQVALISVDVTPVMLDVTAAADGDDWTAVEEQVRAAVDPEGDIHASADYRRHLAGVLSGRALAAALRDARHPQRKVAS